MLLKKNHLKLFVEQETVLKKKQYMSLLRWRKININFWPTLLSQINQSYIVNNLLKKSYIYIHCRMNPQINHYTFGSFLLLMSAYKEIFILCMKIYMDAWSLINECGIVLQTFYQQSGADDVYGLLRGSQGF